MSNLTKCPDCEHSVSIRAKSCPNCGAPLDFSQAKFPVVRTEDEVLAHQNAHTSVPRKPASFSPEEVAKANALAEAEKVKAEEIQKEKAKETEQGCAVGCLAIGVLLIVFVLVGNSDGCRSKGPSAADKQFEEIKKDPERLRKWMDDTQERERQRNR